MFEKKCEPALHTQMLRLRFQATRKKRDLAPPPQPPPASASPDVLLPLLACSETAEAPVEVRMNVSWGALPLSSGRWPQRSGPLRRKSQATQLGISGRHARPVFRNLQLNKNRSGPLPSTLLPYCFFFVIVFIALKKKNPSKIIHVAYFPP